MLALLSGLAQVLDNRRIARDPVKGHLNRQGLRVFGRLVDKVDHRLEVIVWVLQEVILFPDRSKDIVVHIQGWILVGLVRGVAQIRVPFDHPA